jgi:hypothetical protein
MEREEARADRLEREYKEKRATTRSMSPDDVKAQSAHILAVETVHRESLEARLSAMLLRKKYFLLNCKDAADLRQEISAYEQKARTLGLELNNARVAKRSQEYVLNYYMEH